MGSPSLTTPTSTAPSVDPVPVLRGIATLRRLVGTYPAGHPMVEQRLKELDDAVRVQLTLAAPAHTLRIDVVHGEVHLDSVAFATDTQTTAQLIQDLMALGVHSLYINEGVTQGELLTVAHYLWSVKEGQAKDGPSDTSYEAQLSERGVRHISLGRLVPLDTRWRAQQWPENPSGPIDPDYAESIMLAQQTFEQVASGKGLKPATVRDLVQLLMYKVARSNAALSQILAVK